MLSNLIGHKIRQIRELKGFSREYVASKLAIGETAYRKIETGETKLTLERIEQIAGVLELDVLQIMSFDSSVIFHNNIQSIQSNQQIHQYHTSPETELLVLQKEVELLREQNNILRQIVDTWNRKSA